MNEINEIDALAGFRENTPAMSARAQVQGRLRLSEEINGKRPGARRGLLARRTVLLGGAAVTLSLSQEVAAWDTLRDLVKAAPPAQKAALFQAAAKIKGIGYVANATGAAGRSGEAVGLEDPRLGTIQRSAVVDAAGRLPGR